MNYKLSYMLKNISYIILLLLTLFVSHQAFSQDNRIIIDVNFPGGNVIVEENENISTLYYEVSGDTVLVRPDLRDTEGNWFYWYFRVTGAAGETLHFQFPGRHVSSFGPAYLSNKNDSWQWLYDELYDSHDHFTYTFGPDENEVKFSSTIPYVQKNFEEFISTHTGNPYLSIGTLTTSEKGRDVEKLSIRNSSHDSKYKVLITARHHANEAMASYALEGLISSVLDGEDISMQWLRENVEFLIVPFMDKDGVQDGDQGKNRRPYDHNRDYSGESIYNSVAALREKVTDWSNGKLKVHFDLHNPGLSGDWHEHIYFVGARDQILANEQEKYVNILINRNSGELTLNSERAILNPGTAWYSLEPPSEGLSSRGWTSTFDEIALAITLELPFANNDGQIVTPYNAELFGKDMADALSIYLQEL